MATILLQAAAGAVLGGLFGGVGATIGTAAGAVAGYMIDRALLGGSRTHEGPRLASPRPFTAEDGAPIPRLYGTARLGGTLIWATRFQEKSSTERQGAKGGPKVTSYSYFGNAAFALCEGEIAGIRRVWADGRELDLERITMRVHRGAADQDPDPLIEAKQGEGNAPAYRGTAYVVFERLPLGDYGNRLPQLQFEVMRPVGTLHGRIRAMVLIPGSTEFGYWPERITQRLPGKAKHVNRHVLFGATDFDASIDELQALCPNLETVALVVAWFGDDLRAGHCRIRPAESDPAAPAVANRWRVSSVTAGTAAVVSQSDGRPAYGGTPSDEGVIRAIRALKDRGLKVTLYPFVMMDVPAGNGLPNPEGGTGQPAYPWRGRITCHPAPGAEGTADKTSAARTQSDLFFGAAQPEDFSTTSHVVDFDGEGDDWGYRRLVLHYAALAEEAGGVDAFLIGSELRGLTTMRDEAGAYPAVEALAELAGDVRGMLGPDTRLTYGADWTEYFGHQPADGSGDVFFHLDALWAHPAIDAVGIDNYMPLADWRDADHGGENPDGATGPCDAAAMRAAIAGGEGFDWYYADASARRDRVRAPITDGAYGKHWIFRYKDLEGWWANPHFDRPGGVESATPTAWIPRSKPIWFTELGCPACDKGPNQPNVFSDPKSSENALPYFSNGGRSDLAQHRFLETHLGHWDPDAPDFEASGNPLSPVYGGRMVDHERSYVWAWDARPFPTFPLASDVWGDGGNWVLGHWLNGRLANPTAADLINAVLADHDLPPADVRGADGIMTGYLVTDPSPARAVLEQVADIFGLVGHAAPDGLVFSTEGAGQGPAVELAEIVAPDEGAAVSTAFEPAHQLPGEALLTFRDPLRDFQAGAARHVRAGAPTARQEAVSFSGCLEAPEAQALAADWLRRRWRQRERVGFALPVNRRDVRPGSIVRLDQLPGRDFIVTDIDEGSVRQIKARRVDRLPPTPVAATLGDASIEMASPDATPVVHFLDLPSTGSFDQPHGELRVAAWSQPWRPQIVFASPEETGFAERATLAEAARIGSLADAIGPGFSGRIDHRATLRVRLLGGELASISTLQMLNGGNSAAMRSNSGAWEVLQFADAEEVEPGLWLLSSLLRGQLGTEDAMDAGAAADAPFVILDGAVVPAGLRASEAGLPLNWRVGPSGADFGGDLFDAQTVSGGLRASLPLAPVHLSARRIADGDADVTWVRRGRLSADSWEADDIPLGEEAEAYRVEVRNVGGARLRTATVTSPRWTYGASAIAEDFPGGPGPAVIEVRQRKSVSGGLGLPAVVTLDLA